MTKRPNPNDKLLQRALANGAVIEGEAPPAKKPRAAPHHTGEYIHRLMKCAALGWEWIETRDGQSYRWCTSKGEYTVWASYDEITKIPFGPGL